jgi:hypothetical protein
MGGNQWNLSRLIIEMDLPGLPVTLAYLALTIIRDINCLLVFSIHGAMKRAKMAGAYN